MIRDDMAFPLLWVVLGNVAAGCLLVQGVSVSSLSFTTGGVIAIAATVQIGGTMVRRFYLSRDEDLHRGELFGGSAIMFLGLLGAGVLGPGQFCIAAMLVLLTLIFQGDRMELPLVGGTVFAGYNVAAALLGISARPGGFAALYTASVLQVLGIVALYAFCLESLSGFQTRGGTRLSVLLSAMGMSACCMWLAVLVACVGRGTLWTIGFGVLLALFVVVLIAGPVARAVKHADREHLKGAFARGLSGIPVLWAAFMAGTVGVSASMVLLAFSLLFAVSYLLPRLLTVTNESSAADR